MDQRAFTDAGFLNTHFGIAGVYLPSSRSNLAICTEIVSRN